MPMEFQVGDYVEILYRANNHKCYGEIMSIQPYQMSILVCYAEINSLKSQVGHELKMNFEPRGSHVVVKKWETVLTDDDIFTLMHLAVQSHDKEWFEELCKQKKQPI